MVEEKQLQTVVLQPRHAHHGMCAPLPDKKEWKKKEKKEGKKKKGTGSDHKKQTLIKERQTQMYYPVTYTSKKRTTFERHYAMKVSICQEYVAYVATVNIYVPNNIDIKHIALFFALLGIEPRALPC